jgi:ABC-2 type transport system permease protein
MATQPEAIAGDAPEEPLQRSAPIRRAEPRPPRSGWRIVAEKEFGDGVLSVRMFVLLALVGLVAVGTVYSTAAYVSSNAEGAATLPSLFVLIFAHQDPSSQVPSFVVALGFLGPLFGIIFGFDAINSERSERTLSRLVAQPIYRDAVIIGKFVARLAVIGGVLLAIILMVSAVSFIRLGVTVGPEEIVRVAVWFVVALAYFGVWLGFAMLCSVLFRSAAAAIMAAIGVWIVMIIFVYMVGALASLLAPVPANATIDQQTANAQLQLDLSELAPFTLYTDASAYILDPTVQTVGIIPSDQANNQQAFPTNLSAVQSVLLAWPQVVALIALSVGIFGLAYVGFMRQEVRA